MSLAAKKCFNHPNRVAGAKCLECGNFFCDECTTLHDGRRICSNCLVDLSAFCTQKSKWRYVVPVIAAMIGGLVLLFTFYVVAVKLIEIGDKNGSWLLG